MVEKKERIAHPLVMRPILAAANHNVLTRIVKAVTSRDTATLAAMPKASRMPYRAFTTSVTIIRKGSVLSSRPVRSTRTDNKTLMMAFGIMLATGMPVVDNTTCETNNNCEVSITTEELAICPDDEFYSIPVDYVPKAYATMNNRIPELDHVLGPCHISWKRFEMCIEAALDGPTVNYGLAEQKCLKYGLPLVDCFRRNHKGIMKRYADRSEEIS